MTEATNNEFTATDMATAAAQGFRDGVASVRPVPPAAAVVRDAFMKMRNVAAGYSNCCEFDSANTRRLEREFEAADELYRSAAAPTPEPVSPWISVEDRLPADPEWVLVFADGAINCMAWSDGHWEDWTEANMHNIFPLDITHWMPLPPAPEQPAKEQGHE